MPRPLHIAFERALRLGHLLRDTRIERGIRQEDLARTVDIATATLRRIEAGEGKGPNVFVVMRLFDELELDLELLSDLY